MTVKTWMLAGAAILTFAVPARGAEFIVSIGSAGSPVGTPACGGVATGVSSTPVARDVVCSFQDAQAAALFGHVGGSSGANHGGGYFGTSFGISTSSQFSDFVTFTSTDPSVTSALVAANLAFSGTMNVTDRAFTGVDLFYSLDGASGGYVFSSSQNGVARNDFNVAQGSVSSTVNSALLQTRIFSVPLNHPMRMNIRLGTGASVAGSGSPQSARSDFSNSFEVPFGIDAFVLPAGVTANAGDWLVDNRRVDPNAVNPIPEPATWVMMIAGFGFAGASLRQRRRRAAVLA